MKINKEDVEAVEILITNAKHVEGKIGFIVGSLHGKPCRIVVLYSEKGMSPLAVLVPGNSSLFSALQFDEEKITIYGVDGEEGV